MRLLSGALSPLVRATFSRVKQPVPLRDSLDLAAKLSVVEPITTRLTEVTIGVPGLWVQPPRCDSKVPILYFHGGGYIAGSPGTHKRLAARLADLTRRPVFLPAYRLAPEHPLPAAFDDACAAWDGLCAEGFAPETLALGGDSAGGGLALALLAHLCAQGRPPGHAFAWSPFTDLTLQSPSLQDNAATDHFFPAARVTELTKMILGNCPADDPRASPLHAAFPNCPPVLLLASDCEILSDDSRRMTAHLEAQNAPVTLQITPGAPHVWQMFDGFFPEARAAIRATAEFLDSETPRAPKPQLPTSSGS